MRDEVFEVEIAPEVLCDTDTVHRLLLEAWLLAHCELVVQVFESVEVALEVVLGQDESQPAHDANRQVLVVEGCSEFDFFGLLEDSLSVLALVEDPRHGAIFEALVVVVLLICHAISLLAQSILVQFANHSILVVHLEHAQVRQQLAFLHVPKRGAAHCSIHVIVLQSTTLMSESRQ